MWIRCSLSLLCLFCLTSATSAPLPDVNQAGTIMRDLEGDKLLYYVLLFLVVAQFGVVVWAFGKLAKVVEVMATLRETILALNELARSGATNAQQNSNAITGMVATLARIEADMAGKK